MSIKKLTAAVLATLVSAGAHAAFVTQWDYTVTSEFVPGSVQWRAGTAGGRNATTSQVQWGPTGANNDLVTNNRSGVAITASPASGTVTTYDPNNPPPVAANVGLTQIFTHYNRVLDGDLSTLRSINVTTTLLLTPDTPAGPAQPLRSATFAVDFLETTNNVPGSPGTCANGGLEGVGPNENGCGDIFVLAGNLDAAVIPYDGFTYYVSIIETTGSLTPLSDTACQNAGAANGCLGFVTREEQNTPVQFAFLITSEPLNGGVPEPSSIALLGLGLGAFGYAARRSRKAA